MWISNLIAEKVSKIDNYKRILDQALSSDTLSIRVKKATIQDYVHSSGNTMLEILGESINHYKGLPEIEVHTAVKNNPDWKRLEKEQMELNIQLTKWKG